jgi:hypothetical protein
LFGTAHRKPWRSKKAKDREQSTLCGAAITKPGQCVAINQMVSAQEKGNLTRARVWGCAVFVDYATNYTCIILMRDMTAESTLAAKREFEHRCAIRGITVQRYHADNGRFAEPAFVEDCKRLNQKLTYCGVGAHHQNGVAERKIKDIKSNENDAIEDVLTSSPANTASSSDSSVRHMTQNEGATKTNPDTPSVSEGDESLLMPKMINLQQSGLRRSP